MSKDKRQLRAEAVERLRERESSNIEWMILGDDCPKWVEYDTLSYNKAVCERIADLLTDDDLTVHNEASDDELFRCSYCHCKVYNIDMTEGDCGWGFTFCPQCGGEVDEHDSRKIEAKLGEPTNVADGETNGIHADAPLVDEPPEGDAVTLLRKWGNFWSLSHSTGTQCDGNWEKTTMEALADMVERDYVRRDAIESVMDDDRALVAENTRLERERDTLQGALDVAEQNESRLEAERDELAEKLGELGALLSRLGEFDDGLDIDDPDYYERCWAGHVRAIGTYHKRVKELEAERDEWKAKAVGSDKRTNLEWFYENDERFCIAVGEQAFARLSGAPSHPYEVRRWLMSEHVDQSHVSSPNETGNADFEAARAELQAKVDELAAENALLREENIDNAIEYRILGRRNMESVSLVRDIVLCAASKGLDVTGMAVHAYGGDRRTIAERMRELGITGGEESYIEGLEEA